MSFFSCAVPVKVDVNQVLLIPKSQSLKYLKEMEVSGPPYEKRLRGDFSLNHVIWPEGNETPYEDLEISVIKSAADGWYCIYLIPQNADPLGEKRFYVSNYFWGPDKPKKDDYQKTIDALFSMGAKIRKIE